LLGFMAGAEPYLGNPRGVGATNDIPLHFEGFYKYQLTDNISITPGVIWVVNPGQNDANDDVVIGTLRTTFTF
jgi:carbohydrate-selective porin OprB